MRLHRNPLCLLAVVALWLALPLQSLNAQSKPYDWVFNPSNGHWYAPTNSAMSWTSAQSEAAFVHGHLATIRTAEEEEFLFRHVIKGSTQNYWIGLNDISSPNTFVWDSGENYQYRNWAPGEPNNQGGIEECVILRGQHRDWNDWPEAGPALGLIEVELTQWVVNPANGTRYGRTPAMMSWTEAEALAVSLGGHLVTIDNADEESFLLDTFLVDVADNFWIGYYQNHDPPNYSEPDGGWEWISGSSTYEHWAPGEPNNYNGNEDFAILRGQHRDWNDWSDAARAWGIMELPAPTWTVHPTTGHYYAVGRGLTWAPAELEAMQLGGHLATIEDSAENAWLYTAFGSPSGSQDSLYIGFTDERTPGSLNQFEWSSLSTSTYANWASGEPNNRFNDQYVFMQMDAQYSGKWVDQTAWVQHHGIIELDRNPATDFILSAHGLWSGGDARLVARNATPGGTVAFAYSLTPAPGQTTVPIGPCGSVLVDLPSPIHALGVVQADSDGVAVLDAGTIPILKRQPNIRIQAIDLGSCQLSNCMGGWIR